MPSAYPSNREGYWAEDIIKEAMPSAYDSDSISSYSSNGGEEEGGGGSGGGDGGYYAMDILAS